MRKVQVSDIIRQARRLIFQPDKDNSNFSDPDILSFINDVKDTVFSDVPLLPFERSFIADGVSNQFVIADDINRIERVLKNDGIVRFINNAEFLSSEQQVVFTDSRFKEGRFGAFFRDNILFMKPTPVLDDEIKVRLRGIPNDFTDLAEFFIAPNITRQVFIKGTVMWLKQSLDREDNAANTSNAREAERLFNDALNSLKYKFKRADNPRENVITEVL